jgi:hypothetical protein
MTRLSQLVVVSFTLFFSISPAATAKYSFYPTTTQEVEPSGCAKGDCFNGYGTYHYANGNRYVGDFKSGQPDGQGILYCANGNKYLGHWEQNWRQGEGRFIFSEGHEYTGAFHRNLFHGKGKMRYANGDVYQGDWQFNQPEGSGIYSFYSGNRYEGDFRAGRFNGQGTMFYKDGSKYLGNWRDNKKSGTGTFYDSTGRIATQTPAGTEEEAVLVESSAEIVENEQQRPRQPENQETVTVSSVRIWAVVVGIATYQHMPSLKFTDDDAYQFYAFLKSPEGGALTDDQVRILVDDNATRDNILTAMRSTFLKADENDVVLFYYSGHGLEGAFIPVDFDGYNYRLLHTDIRQLLDQSKAKYKIVLGDACHSGSLTGSTLKSDLLASRSVQSMLDTYYKAFENCQGGTALLMSSKSQEVSLEDGGLRSGVFSYFLVKGLKGQADADRNKLITIGELFNYVSQKVSVYTAGAQTPVITGQYDKQMPVGVVR